MEKKSKKRPPKIPEGFQELLESLSYDVLMEQPTNLLQFCIENLISKLQNQKSSEHLNQENEEHLTTLEFPKDNTEEQRVSDANTKSTHIHDNAEKEWEAENESLDGFFRTSSNKNSTKNYFRRQGVAAESWDPEKQVEIERVVYPKTEEQKEKLIQSFHNILLLRCLDDDDYNEVVDAMFERRVHPGENVITIGEPGDNFYIIESGIYDVYVKVDNELKKVSQYVEKGSFGELALMYNTPRAATVTAVTEGCLWAMSRETFRAIILNKAFKKRQLYESLLESVDLLKALNPYERMSLADALHTRIVEAGEAVFLEGDMGEEMYFIESGSVSVKMEENEEVEQAELCTLGKSQYFGELALVTKKPRAASVYALERTRLAVLEVDSFERILGPCQAILERKAEEYAERRKQVSITKVIAL